MRGFSLVIFHIFLTWMSQGIPDYYETREKNLFTQWIVRDPFNVYAKPYHVHFFAKKGQKTHKSNDYSKQQGFILPK